MTVPYNGNVDDMPGGYHQNLVGVGRDGTVIDVGYLYGRSNSVVDLVSISQNVQQNGGPK